MSKKSKQVLLMLLTAILAVFVGGSLYLYFWLKHSVPVKDGAIELGNITAPVEITFDSLGIPQIWAKSESDGFFALGYCHASDRMFQMDMARRVSQGRLSELLGNITLEMDKRQRQIGHNRLAKIALEQLDEKNRLRLEAYANGVNAYKNSSGALSFEYLLLGATFDSWTVYDCLTLLSYQTWYSDALQNHDQFYGELVKKVGEEKARSLFYLYPDWAPVTIPGTKKIGLLDSITSKSFGWSASGSELASQLMTNSSNSWVIGSDKSVSGKAILASDPHLQINQLPQFWYMLGLHIEDGGINVLGISTPGLPFVIMGHNGQAAWAFTAGGVDVTDIYSEKVNPENNAEYQTPSGWSKFDFAIDTILVSGLDTPVVLTTKITRHGPIIYESDSGYFQSFRWAGYDADINLAASSGFELMRANDFKNFRKIVTSLGALNANWMYADQNGQIGYQLGTPIPKRKGKSNQFSLSGWTNEFEWDSYYPLDKTPHSFNPFQGWLASCNNLSTRNSQFSPVSGSFAADRILRITELLSRKNEFSISDCQEFQFDRTDKYLLRWRWTMAKYLLESGQHELSELINNWDGSTGLDSKETALTMVFLTELRRLTFGDELGEMYQGVRTIWMDEVFNNPNFEFWFDDTNTETIESKDDVTRIAVTRAVDIVSQKTWRDFNSLTMQHPMAGVPALGGLLALNRGTLAWPGTSGTLNASYLIANDDYSFETIVGPSWRFLIDFADIDGALFVLPAGNSGNPMSPHFFDFNQMWQEGKYWNIPISKERVQAKAVSTLLINPISPVGN